MSRVSEAARLKCSGEDECVLSHIFPLSDTGRMLEEERKIALVCRGQDSHPFQCLCDLTVKRRSRLLLHSSPPLLAASQCTCPHTHPLAFIHFLTISPRLYLSTGLERIHPPPHTTYYHTHTHTLPSCCGLSHRLNSHGKQNMSPSTQLGHIHTVKMLEATAPHTEISV